MQKETVWMRSPDGGGPYAVPADPKQLVPLMVAGWNQCKKPGEARKEEGEPTDNG